MHLLGVGLNLLGVGMLIGYRCLHLLGVDVYSLGVGMYLLGVGVG